ncbi:uncharacterized protein LOC130049764 [Ostrea edulis]|uniref:uncharacterized protein LOC130049764 n=1 Tax=Ostrea edulis TaxID=37623 RepID=UPI0024AF52BD|nr:uncharacterized protein LOC130049764 [Ostrea edulis]
MSSSLIVVATLMQFVSNTTCFVNLVHTPGQSLQGQANMNIQPTDARWTAQRAVDGNINQLYSGNSCAVTQLHSEPLWWKVWFNRIFNIAYLEVYFGSDTYPRSTGFYIYIYDDKTFSPPSGNTGSIVYHHDPMSGCPVSVMNITVNRIAHGVAFYNERPPGFSTVCPDVDANQTSLGICEVKVHGMFTDRKPMKTVNNGCQIEVNNP